MRGVPVGLVVHGVVKTGCVFLLRGHDVAGLYHPDAGAFPAPYITIPCVTQGLFMVFGGDKRPKLNRYDYIEDEGPEVADFEARPKRKNQVE